MFSKLITFSLLFFCICSLAQSSVDELFSQGLKSYQSGQLEEAEDLFQQALQQQPNNASLLYNLGLTQHKSGKAGPAIASWRKALIEDPSLTDARDAITFAFTKLEHRELPHQVILLESLRSSYLQWVSLPQMVLVFALTLFTFGWTSIKYLGLRKTALSSENTLPSIPIKLILLLLVFIGVSFLTGAKVIDTMTARGTIISKTIDVHAGPDPEQATLFELYEGLEVLIDETQNDWVKVTYPGGRSGWIPTNSLEQTK